MNSILTLKIEENTLRQSGQQEFAVAVGDEIVGVVNLQNYDPVDMRAEIGLYIEATHRGKGYGKAAIVELMKYCKEVLNMHQIVCDIAEDNIPSLHLFESLSFTPCGILKDWTATPKGWCDAVRMQKIF